MKGGVGFGRRSSVIELSFRAAIRVEMEKPLNVLFLCTGNSARSIMAECILNRLGVGKFKAYSAGSQPRGTINPHALTVLRKSNFDVSGLRSKSWKEFSGPNAPKLDFVFTVCDDAAKESCPIWPGQPMTAHWQRIGIFVNLRLDDLSKLQQHLDEIGQSQSA
jgi:arsenate reductase (thioredoxin)